MKTSMKSLSVIVSTAIAGALLAVSVPMAVADDERSVASARSFPGVTVVNADFLAESTTVTVDDEADWGGIESLDVPQTKSPAEIEAEEAARRAEQEARERQQQQRQAAAAASRSDVRTSADASLAGGTSVDYGMAPAGFDPNHATGDVGNRYAAGNCTWWAYERRHQLGLPVGSFFGNGGAWAASARALGYWVDSTPRMVGDIMVFQGGQAGSSIGYGHVAIVEEIYADGSVRVSEMGSGFAGGFSSTRVFSDTYNYQYIHF